MQQANSQLRQRLISSDNRVARSRRGVALAALAATGAILAASAAHAGTETWVGNTDTTWSNAANWTGTNLPPVTGDSLIFAAVGSQGSTLNDSEGVLTLAGLNFDAANAAYIINPAAVATNTLDFGAGAVISNNSAFLQTINTEAMGSSSFTVQGSGSIAMQRVRMANSAGSNVLTMNGTGTLFLGNTSATTSDNNLALLVNSGTVDLGMNGSNIAIDRGLTINAGQVIFTGNSTNMISSGQPVVMAGSAVLDLNGDSDTIGVLTGSSGTTVQNSNASNTSTLSFGANIATTTFANGTFSGNLINSGSGILAITKTGSGTETLSGVNTYSGATTVSNGTLNITAAAALPSASSIAFNYGGISVNSGGVVNSTGSTMTLSNAVTFPGNAVFNGSGNFNFTSGAFSVATTGTKNIALGGTASVIFTGTLSNTTDSSWQMFDQGNSYPFFIPSGTLTLGAINISVAANDTLTLGGWINETISGVITNGGTASNSILTVSNIGTTTLLAANTFAGNMNLGPAGAEPGGTVAVGNAQSLGLGTVVWNSFALQSTTALTGANAIPNAITFQGGAQTNPATASDAQVSGTNAIELSGPFTNTASNRTLLVTNTGGTTISGPVYLSEASATGRTLTILADGPTTISGTISNFNGGGTAGGLAVSGTNTLTLSGANIYTGSTTLSGGGTLTLDYTTQNNNKISSTASLITNGGETLNLNGGSFLQVVSASTLSAGGDLNITRSSGTSTLQLGTVTRSNGSGLNVGTAGIATTNNSNSATGGLIGGWATVAGTDWAVSAASAANTAITAYPSGSYQTGADSTWATTDNVSISGTSALTASRTINSFKAASTGASQAMDLVAGDTLTINTGGLLFTGSNNYTIKNGTIKPGQASSPELILNQWGTGTLTISSVIANGSAASQLTKLGSGTVVLANTNTYTGTTFIDNGTLALGVNNAISYSTAAPQDIQMAGGGVLDLAGHTQSIRNVNITNNSITGGTVTSSAPGGVLTENSTITNGANSNLLFTGQLGLVLSEPGTGTAAITLQLSNPLNNFSGGVTVSGSGTFSTSQLSTAGTSGTNLSSWVGTSDLRVNANTAAGTGPITLNDGRVWSPSATFYTVSNNILVTANGGWLNSDNSSNAYLGTISTISGSPLLAIGGDTNSRPTINLWGSMSGFTGTLAVDTENSNVNLYGSSLGSSTANLLFYNNGTIGNVGWSGSIASPVTISFAELSTLANSTGGHLTANVAANVTYQIGDNTNNTTTFSGIIQNGSGLVSLTKIGTNNQVLSGTHTYTGPTTVSGGTLSISGALNSGSASTVTAGTLLAIGSGVIPGSVTVNGGAAGVSTGGTISGAVTVNAGGALTALGTSTVGASAGTFSGPVIIAGGTSPAARGSINLIDNTIKTVNLTGGLTIGGTAANTSTGMSFDFGSNGNNSDLLNLTVSPLTVNLGGATISLSNLGSNPGGGQIYTLMTYPSATGAGFATGTGTTVGSLSLATTNFGPLSTELIVTSTALEVQVNGTVVTPAVAYWTGMVDNKWNSFSGANANFATTPAGTTSISGFLGSTTDVYFGANSASNLTTTLGQNFTVQTLNFTGTGTSGTGAYVINGNTSGASLLTIAGNSSGGGITLAAGSGGATINVSSLVLGSTQTWTNNSANPLTVNSAISQGGTAGLTLAAGTFILGGSNTYSGGTTINAGLVQLTGSGTLGTSTNTLTMGGGTLDLHGLSSSVGELNGTAGTIENNGTGTATLSFASDNSGGGNFQGNIVDNTNSGTGKVAVAMTGNGSATLSGADTYSGGTTISGGGTLTVGSTTALGAASNSLTLTNNSTLQLNGYSESIGILSGASGTTISNSGSTPSTLTVTIPGTTAAAFLGTISDGGSSNAISLVKAGTGSLALSANGNSFNGNASILQGTVGVNAGNDLGNGTLTIGDGSTAASAGILLGGAGYTVSNPITIAAGGTGTYSITSNTNVDFTLSGPITLNNNLFLSCNVSHAVFLDGVITGSSTITIDGGGTSGSSSFNNFFDIGASDAGTFTGNIVIQNGGFLKLTTNVPANTVLGVPTIITMGPATTLDTGGATFTIAGLNGTVGANAIDFSGALTIGGAGNYNFAGQISNSGSFVMNGTGKQTLTGSNGYTGGTNVASGTLVFAAPYALPNFSSLTVGAGALASAASHSVSAVGASKNNLFVSNLSLAGATGAWTGKVDLANNDMIVQNGDLAQITNQIAQGFNNGGWNGSGGIVSTAAAADATHLHALGVIQNSADGTTSGTTLYGAFDGASAAASTDVLVKYTYYGDADLSGVVDGSDYSRIDIAFLNNQNSSNIALTGWFNGDFNYDGVINGSDYTLIDNAYNSQGAAIAAELASPTAQQAGGSASSVPEPATLGLLGIGAIGLLGRRNCRR